MDQPKHETVLLEETLEWLAVRPGGHYVDLTLGCGGLTRRLLDAVGLTGLVVGIDRDPDLLAETVAEMREEGYGPDRFEARAGSFAEVDHLLGERRLDAFDGFVADLGVSSPHLDRSEYGFSFRDPGPLDMRFDRSQGKPLSEWLREWDERELRRIIREYGEDRFAPRIARAICQALEAGELTDTAQLAEVIRRAYPARFRHESRIDPATRTCQALRIAVNDELGHVRRGVMKVLNGMKPGARFIVISFHSLEDRVVKKLFRAVSESEKDFYGHPLPAVARELTRKPARPSEAEVAVNPRARSAKMRGLEKLTAGTVMAGDNVDG